MKNTLFIAITALFFSSTSWVQTMIKNNQEVFGKWTKKGSPYIIDGTATVPEGKTLMIKKGVVVKFRTGTSPYIKRKNFDKGWLDVKGNLIAKGSKKAKILFTRDGDKGTWGSIAIRSSSGKNTMAYCIVEHGHYISDCFQYPNGKAASALGSIGVFKCHLNLTNSIIRHNEGWGGIYTKEATVDVSYSIFHNCNWGIINYSSTYKGNHNTVCLNKKGYFSESSTLNIKNAIIQENEKAFHTTKTNTINVSYSSLDDEKCQKLYVNKGNNNIGKENPFINIKDNSFKITKESQCYKKASDKKNMGAIIK